MSNSVHLRSLCREDKWQVACEACEDDLHFRSDGERYHHFSEQHAI